MSMTWARIIEVVRTCIIPEERKRKGKKKAEKKEKEKEKKKKKKKKRKQRAGWKEYE